MIKKYKTGIFSWYGYSLPIFERLKLISEAGFDATTIWWEDEVGFEGGEIDKVPSMVRELGLYLENAHVPFYDCNDFWSKDDIARNNVVKKHIKWIKELQQHYIPVMVMHVSDGWTPPAPCQEGLDALYRVVHAAETAGVRLAIENTMNQDEYADYIFSEISSDYVGFCYDSSHDMLLCSRMGNILKKYGDRLFSVHLSDNDKVKDMHWIPGLGKIDWNDVSEAFPGRLVSGCITLEVLPDKQAAPVTPQEFLTNAHKSAVWLNELLSLKE